MIHHVDGFTLIYHMKPAWRFIPATLMCLAKLTRYMRVVRVEIHVESAPSDFNGEAKR